MEVAASCPSHSRGTSRAASGSTSLCRPRNKNPPCSPPQARDNSAGRIAPAKINDPRRHRDCLWTNTELSTSNDGGKSWRAPQNSEGDPVRTTSISVWQLIVRACRIRRAASPKEPAAHLALPAAPSRTQPRQAPPCLAPPRQRPPREQSYSTSTIVTKRAMPELALPACAIPRVEMNS